MRPVAKMGFRPDVLKDMLKEMFNRVQYVPTDGVYIDALHELRKLEIGLAAWI